MNHSEYKTNNNNGIVIAHTAELFDATPYIPDTIKSENIMPKINDVNTEMEEGELSKREAGFMKYFITTTSEGNRNGQLYNAACFFRDLGTSDPYSKIYRLNKLLDNPLPDHEVEQIAKSAGII